MLGRKGQYIVEYGILLAVVTGALVTMQLYVHRAIKGTMKLVEDQASEYGESWKQSHATGTVAQQPNEILPVTPQLESGSSNDNPLGGE